MREGFCRFAIHTQAWSSLRVEGLRSTERSTGHCRWQTQLSGRLCCQAVRGRGRHDRAMVIGGDKFSGKPSDWADVKTEIVSAIETAGYSYITKMGAHLFSVDGSGDHGHVEDGDLEKHFKKQMWPT